MLYSYKMSHDVGFAPNPFHGFMSLATCKPCIRKTKKTGHYIAGFTSKMLCNELPGNERMVYIMKVTGIVSFEEYWNKPDFESKRTSGNSKISLCGDNIYKPISDADPFNSLNYVQIKNPFHDESRKETDLSGRNVLLSDQFFYFGKGAIPVDKYKIRVPRYQTAYGVCTKEKEAIVKLWSYLLNNFQMNTVINDPHLFLNHQRSC